MKNGEIWLVDFDPSFGHEHQKVRPALVIESNPWICVYTLGGDTDHGVENQQATAKPGEFCGVHGCSL